MLSIFLFLCCACVWACCVCEGAWGVIAGYSRTESREDARGCLERLKIEAAEYFRRGQHKVCSLRYKLLRAKKIE